MVHGIIYEELCRGIVRAESKARYLAEIERLRQAGADGVILGCTEITMLIGQADLDLPVFDTTRLHAEAAMDFALGGGDESASGYRSVFAGLAPPQRLQHRAPPLRSPAAAAGRRRWAGSAGAGPAATAASRISATSRSCASWRLRSWLRNRCALITSTPSWVSRRPGQPLQPLAHAFRQRRRAADVEAQLDRGLDLVDVLPAGAGRTHEAELELALVQGDMRA